MNSKDSSWLLIISLFYTFFVIYGSLVPFQFRPIPIEAALALFKEIPFLNLGIHSRADWVSNILLFIPLTFFWMAYFSPAIHSVSSMKFNPVIAMTLFFLSLTLSLSIEFTQLFFPPRTVSLNDLMAETMGALLGILLYWQFGHFATKWIKKWSQAQDKAGKLEQVLYLYLFILFGYSVLPLDLTISPVEVYHKWTEGKVYLIPFVSTFKGDISEIIYNFFSDIAIWIPVSLLWTVSKKKTPSQATLWTWTAALILEFLQLFVYSRVSDTTDLITAAIGAWLGVKIATIWKPSTVLQTSLEKNHLWLPISLVFGWSIFLLIIYWYPFNFQSDAIFLKERLALFFNVPFTAFYYGTEFRAITSLISKMAFFFPLGYLLATLSRQLFLFFKEKIPEKLFIFLSIAYITFFGLTIELVQAALPEKSVDSADCLLSIIGALIGYIIYRYISSHSANMSKTHQQKPTLEKHQIKKYYTSVRNRNKSATIIFLLVLFIITTSLYIISQSSSVPYNIRELISGSHPLLNAIGLSITFFCCFGFPLFSIISFSGQFEVKTTRLMALVLLHCIVSWLLLRLFAPIESLHDIIGSPTFGVVPEIEMVCRFIGLFIPFSIALFMVASSMVSWFKQTPEKTNHIFSFFVLVLIGFPLSYWIVVIEAGTDNLIELLANEGRSLSVLGIALYFFILTIPATLLSASLTHPNTKKWLISLIILVVSFPLAYLCINWATESLIVKYGRVFSALQFLFSPDREHLISGNAIVIHFMFVHALLLLLISLSQLPAWLAKPLLREIN